LEFLGDAVLDAIVAAILYDHFKHRKEGFLTNTRSKIVKRDSLNHIATELGLDKMVICSAKPVTHNNHLYGNALEALIGAIYLDQGYEKCVQFVKHKIIDKYINLEEVAKKEINFKSVILEWCQKHKVEVSFNLIESFVDNDGNPVFQTEIVIAGRQIGVGIGFSKKESHQKAAQMAVKKIRTDKEFKEYIKAYKAAKNDPTASTEEVSDIIDETTLANGNISESNTEEKD
jgi:ribonuclease-3